jgi:hypothetical protein
MDIKTKIPEADFSKIEIIWLGSYYPVSFVVELVELS